jgi:hypothetical protein
MSLEVLGTHYDHGCYSSCMGLPRCSSRHQWLYLLLLSHLIVAAFPPQDLVWEYL